MLYFYTEDPAEHKAAWSPLYVRKTVESDGRSLLDEISTEKVKAHWERLGALYPEQLHCDFSPVEKVVTCRRICTLLGILDLSNPSSKVLDLKQIGAGAYKLHWRFQIFDTSWSSHDEKFIRDQMGIIQDEYHGNPMNFPVWTRNHWSGVLQQSVHDSPSRPALCLSAGYAKSVLPTNFKDLNYEIGHDLLAHQILLKAETSVTRSPDSQASTRVDHWIRQDEFFQRRDAGWTVFSPSTLFQIGNGRQPTFVVCAIDSGNWLGGFRFAGVHLERVGEKKKRERD
nr:hypothetical protein B0A51_17320 [Rachicladosporium sp. CCFEE 5018]